MSEDRRPPSPRAPVYLAKRRLRLRIGLPPQYSAAMKRSHRRSLRRRILGALLTLVAIAGLGTPASQAQGWPQRPIKLLVPFAAGGNIDVMGRLMAARLSETIGQQIIVENRVGR